MAAAIIASQGAGTTGFATTLDVSIDFGAVAGRAVAVSVMGHSNAAGGGPVAITSVVVDPAGANITLTGSGLTTSTGGSNFYQTNTSSQEYSLVSDTLPTGTKTVRLTMANGNSKPQMWVTTLNGVTSERGTVALAWGLSSSPSVSITTAVDDLAVAHIRTIANLPDTYTVPATSPSTQQKRVLATESNMRGAVFQRAGASGSISLAGQFLNAGTPTSDAWGAAAWAFVGAAAGATATTLTGPSSGAVGSASTAFTVGANGAVTGTVTVTPSDGGGGGSFSPTTVAISSGTPTATFTYSAGTAGVKTISISDNGGLTDAASLSYTASTSTSTASVANVQNGSGTSLAGTVLPNVVVIRRSDRALVLAGTSLTVGVGGTLSVPGVTAAAGTGCMVAAFENDGSLAGIWPATTA